MNKLNYKEVFPNTCGVKNEPPLSPLVPAFRKTRGFQVVTKARMIQIASQGGIKAHQLGKAHQFTTEEARKAGRKGGLKVSQNRKHMSEIGRKGGNTPRKNEKQKTPRNLDLQSSPNNGEDGSTNRKST